MPKQGYIYILASARNRTLYIGVTSDLLRRVWEHRNNVHEGFTKRYGVHSLVYFEAHTELLQAIGREKQMKRWNRQWKLKIIEDFNPKWRDLYDELAE
ncbi:MAG: GIY-YIG nuclease family protein [Gemmatimonadota bacterium]